MLFYSKKTNSLLLSLSLSLSCSSDITDLHCSKNHVLYMVLFKFVFKKEWCLSRGGGGRRGRKKKNEVSKKKGKKLDTRVLFLSFLFYFSRFSLLPAVLFSFSEKGHTRGGLGIGGIILWIVEKRFGGKRGEGGRRRRKETNSSFSSKG